MDKQKNFLLRRFHTLLGKYGANKEVKAAILESYGVTSSRDLDTHELLDVCDKLEKDLNPALRKSDALRKQVMAAIGSWLKAMNREQNSDLVKAIACRAAGATNFNRIPDERLRSLYYAFLNKRKDLAFVDELTKEELDKASMN